jgi:hypothetical protein
LRPSRSAERPNGTSSAAKTIAYALRIHDSSASVEPVKSARMSGKAMLTMNRSRLLMKTAVETTASTCHLRCFMQRTVQERVA